ncbi:hypothetical protein Pint_05213 [Pistacia integerrima]|uniref:Uncharacterized protein n=1 Tax=Pistacia integerrima TaxID=434235 RepID=A0ACC0Z392_9ROSI|nr:hypothetical protein Pint_05213 [Pistacia integerrima]
MAKEVRIFFSQSNQIVFSLKMACKIKAIRERLTEIAKDGTFHLDECRDEKQVVHIETEQTHSFVREENVIGRDDDKSKVIKLLLESNEIENVSVIPIVGLGGIGKTTLAQLVYNDKKIINHFNLRMWVCVSEIDGKKYLLVLDDVWDDKNPDKWAKLKDLLMDGAQGSKILVTTRNEKVARITSKFPSQSLTRLSEDESWSLFMQVAFGRGLELKDKELVTIGKGILAKCLGVPLAIRTIGHLLCDHNRISDWLQFRDCKLSEIAPEENGIVPILKLSYDHLPSHLKQCFAYCALFPKDFVFEKKSLIYNWMAQGFLYSKIKNACEEDVGEEYFMNLFSRSFFQEAKYDKLGNIETCKMHDLTQIVAGSECILTTLDGKSFNEKAHYVTFHVVDSSAETSREIPPILVRSNNIRAISFLSQSFHWDGFNHKSTFKKLLSSIKSVRMLDLSNSRISKLPNSIGKLKHLRYLKSF